MLVPRAGLILCTLVIFSRFYLCTCFCFHFLLRMFVPSSELQFARRGALFCDGQVHAVATVFCAAFFARTLLLGVGLKF